MTQECPNCGAPTQTDEDFCGECGAYLDWEQRPVDEAPLVVLDEPSEPPAPSRSLTERVKAVVGRGDSAAAEDPLLPSTPPAHAAVEEGHPSEDPATDAGPSVDPAAALVVKVPPSGPPVAAPVKPGL